MELIINDNLLKVIPVITRQDIENGMMYKKFNDDFNGMLFVFNEISSHSFWMKNCITSLDIIFIKDLKINKIHSNCPPCREDNCPRYSGVADLILEINGGDCEKYDIKEGDSVFITD